MKKDLEQRAQGTTVAPEEESRTVSGYAALFEKPTNSLPWVEVIKHGAFDGVIERSDVKCWLNHNHEKGLLARSKNGVGSLKLTVDEKGLHYEFEAPKTAVGDELVEGLRRKDITESSFAFYVKRQEIRRVDDVLYRDIIEFDVLTDVSPVYDAAYEGTEVTVRSLEIDEVDLTEYYKQQHIYYND